LTMQKILGMPQEAHSPCQCKIDFLAVTTGKISRFVSKQTLNSGESAIRVDKLVKRISAAWYLPMRELISVKSLEEMLTKVLAALRIVKGSTMLP